MMHAVWLGLSSLLKYYPSLKVDEEPALAASAGEFRRDAVELMRKDGGYREAVLNQLQLWLSVDCDLLFGLEDFFVLPPSLQSVVVDLNQQVQLGGADPSLVDYEELVELYMKSLLEEQEDSGKKFFMPLGELELDALCRIYKIRLQVIKTESLELIAEGSRRMQDVSPEDEEHVKRSVAPALKELEEKSSCSEDAREAVDTVLLYLNNILDSRDDHKFRSIRAGNAGFQRRVGKKEGGCDLMASVGFTRETV
ncbi:hypothetical protein GUITHDRAFT_153980, partial [Guillardia theta CCMP2712]